MKAIYNALDYSATQHDRIVIRRSFSIQIILWFLLVSSFLLETWEVSLDGRHNPNLWFFMNPSEYWKGYLGIALRQTTGYFQLVATVLFLADLLRLVLERHDTRIPTQIRSLQKAISVGTAIVVAYLVLAPKIDL